MDERIQGLNLNKPKILCYRHFIMTGLWLDYFDSLLSTNLGSNLSIYFFYLYITLYFSNKILICNGTWLKLNLTAELWILDCRKAFDSLLNYKKSYFFSHIYLYQTFCFFVWIIKKIVFTRLYVIYLLLIV